MGALARRYWAVDGPADVRARATSDFAFSQQQTGGKPVARRCTYVHRVGFLGTGAVVWVDGWMATESDESCRRCCLAYCCRCAAPLPFSAVGSDLVCLASVDPLPFQLSDSI